MMEVAFPTPLPISRHLLDPFRRFLDPQLTCFGINLMVRAGENDPVGVRPDPRRRHHGT
jgi:hypothetical protein